MKLLIIFGPPAVGKATVGSLIEEASDFKLFHNHMMTDGIMHIFGKESESESRMSRLVRSAVIEEAARSGMNLIFTYVWNFANPGGKRNIDHYKGLYEKYGGTVEFVELYAPLEKRVKRADSEQRWKMKYHSANGQEVRLLENGRSFESPVPFYYPEQYHRIDATKPAKQTAAEIIKILGVNY